MDSKLSGITLDGQGRSVNLETLVECCQATDQQKRGAPLVCLCPHGLEVNDTKFDGFQRGLSSIGYHHFRQDALNSLLDGDLGQV